MNNAELLVAILHRAGIRHGFGIPSGNVLPLMEAMRQGGIDFVLTAHEGSAGFAADVMARQSGVPGLAIATLGPGATNLATGVGSAFLDRSPLIAVTCNIDTVQHGHRIQMAIDHHALFAPITKASFALRQGQIGETVAEALALAASEPLGPVHLDLPEDVALARATEALPSPRQPAPIGVCGPQQLREGVERLGAAARPVAVIGASAMRLANPALLREFVERLELPFATTTMAKGIIDEAHPLALGCIERACRQLQREFLARADLIVGLGYDPIEVEYEAWTDRPVLHVDFEAARPVGGRPPVSNLVGSLAESLSGLAKAQPRGSISMAEVQAHRERFTRALRPPEFAGHSGSLAPFEVIDMVREVLPGDGVLAFDVGAHTHQVASQWVAPAPRSFLITNGWSSMGFGLPAAIAAKLAEPQRPVVCLLGDGCFQMTCGELAVARRLGLTLPVVVLDDGWLGLIKVKQERREFPHYGTSLQGASESNTSFEPPAHYFGVPAQGVSDLASLRSVLLAALDASGPTVIEARVDPAHYSRTVFD